MGGPEDKFRKLCSIGFMVAFTGSKVQVQGFRSRSGTAFEVMKIDDFHLNSPRGISWKWRFHYVFNYNNRPLAMPCCLCNIGVIEDFGSLMTSLFRTLSPEPVNG